MPHPTPKADETAGEFWNRLGRIDRVLRIYTFDVPTWWTPAEVLLSWKKLNPDAQDTLAQSFASRYRSAAQ